MLISTYNGRSGLIAQQQRLDVIANNLANVNTNGYKSVRADFKDALYQTMVRPVQPQDDLNLQKGHGVLLGATTRDFAPGTASFTGLPFDLLITGDGFFNIQDANSETTLYTRDGSFHISAEEDGNYLVTADGYYLVSGTGERINIGNLDHDDVSIQPNGSVWDAKNNVQIGQIGLSTFVNRKGLEAVGGNRFLATEASGEPVAAGADVEIQQGYIESSNVDMANEMVRMIRAQRAFSLASRAVTTADEMDSQANTIRG